MVLLLGVFGFLSYWLGYRFAGTGWGVRWAICVVLGGLLAYTYLAISLPGAAVYLHKSGWSGMMGVVLLGASVGFGSAYAWYRLAKESRKPIG